MNDRIYVCFGKFTEPTADHECPEVVWSEGKACRKCPNKNCYRNGWTKKQVTEDNKKLCAERMKHANHK